MTSMGHESTLYIEKLFKKLPAAHYSASLDRGEGGEPACSGGPPHRTLLESGTLRILK